MTKVVHFERFPKPHLFSMESVFKAVRAALPADVAASVWRCRRAPSSMLARLRDAWAARSGQGDVNHITGDAHYLTWFLDRHRTILTIHDTEALDRMSGIKQAIYKLLWFTIPARRCARIVVISEATRAALARHIDLAVTEVVTIPDPLSLQVTPNTRPFNADQPVVLHIGTKANKNLPRHIAALKGLPVRLLVIGALDAEQRAQLDGSGINWENRVNLSDGEMAAVYGEADMLLFASLVEGFGLPVIEAQAAGIPVITSNVSALPEVAGDGALLVDPRDVAAIKDAVSRLIKDPTVRSDLISAGRINVTRFAPESVAALYADLYREVARQAAA